MVQENENIQLIADPSLPGISMVRKGDKAPHMLIQVFHLPNKDINDVIRTLEKSENWDKRQTCKFEEIKSQRKGVRKFIIFLMAIMLQKLKHRCSLNPFQLLVTDGV